MPRPAMLAGAAAVAMSLIGCAGASRNYRLLPNGVLAPPGVRDERVQSARFRERTSGRPRDCEARGAAVAIEARRRSVRVAVTRAALENLPAGALTHWAAEQEAAGCLPEGSGLRVARQVARAVPLPAQSERRFLGSQQEGFTELYPGYRLKVVSPVFETGASERTLVREQVGPARQSEGGALELTVKRAEVLLGYETAWLALAPRQGSHGARLQFLNATRQLGEEQAGVTKAQTDFLRFDEAMAHFRLLFMTRVSETVDRDSFVAAGGTLAELDAVTAEVKARPERCAELAREGRCAVAPPGYALLAFMEVEVNGEPVLLPPGVAVGAALRESRLDVDGDLTGLVVNKPFQDTRARVEFSPGDDGILRLPLMGGESIFWRR